MGQENPTRAYIGIGSNLDNPKNQVAQALTALTITAGMRYLGCSPWYHSKAIGPGEQPNYLNGVAEVDTYLSPDDLLTALLTIESAQGRVRHQRWAARALDLDILLYGDNIVATDRLQIPHPRLQERNFVLYPLADLAPDLIFPNGQPLASLLRQTTTDGLQKLD